MVLKFSVLKGFFKKNHYHNLPLILHSDPCPTSPAHFHCRFPNMTLVQETWIEQLLFVSTEMLISTKKDKNVCIKQFHLFNI